MWQKEFDWWNMIPACEKLPSVLCDAVIGYAQIGLGRYFHGR